MRILWVVIWTTVLDGTPDTGSLIQYCYCFNVKELNLRVNYVGFEL